MFLRISQPVLMYTEVVFRFTFESASSAHNGCSLLDIAAQILLQELSGYSELFTLQAFFLWGSSSGRVLF